MGDKSSLANNYSSQCSINGISMKNSINVTNDFLKRCVLLNKLIFLIV